MTAAIASSLILIAPGAFATLVVSARKHGGIGVAVASSVVWIAAACLFVFVTLPSPDMPLHDFERSPVPGIAASVTGTIVGLLWTIWKHGHASSSVRRTLAVASAYALASAVGGLVAFLLILFY